ncbi:MAG: macro domain-containing protein [Ktedonobacterales bacterium]
MRQTRLGNTTIDLVVGDITHAGTEALVTAANASLVGGGGVDGAIHRAAGPELLAAIRRIGRCPTGSAVVTPAFRLPPPTRRVIHAVGPVYRSYPPERADEHLRGAYAASLAICEQEGLRSVGLPSISTGVYGYPVERAAPVAIDTILAHLRAHAHSSLELVRLVLYNEQTAEVYERALERATATGA